MILIRDLIKENIQNIFGEEMGGVRGTQTPLLLLLKRIQNLIKHIFSDTFFFENIVFFVFGSFQNKEHR